MSVPRSQVLVEDSEEGNVDFGNLAIGGVQVLVLVVGIVEACKRFGLQGKGAFGLALGLGFAFVGMASAIEMGVVPAEWVPYVEIVAKGLGGALAATGIYDLVCKVAGRGEGVDVEPDW